MNSRNRLIVAASLGLGVLAGVACNRTTQAAAETATSAAPVAEAEPKDIVDTAVAAGQFKTLAIALTAAGLIDTLKCGVHSPYLHPRMKLLRSFPKAPTHRF